MKQLPFTEQDDWRWRWMQGDGDAPEYPLHRIAMVTKGGSHDECERLGMGVGCVGETVCGMAGSFSMPGMFSRMGAPRCPECCRRLSIPEGEGAPFNSEDEDIKNEPTEWLGEAWKA